MPSTKHSSLPHTAAVGRAAGRRTRRLALVVVVLLVVGAVVLASVLLSRAIARPSAADDGPTAPSGGAAAATGGASVDPLPHEVGTKTFVPLETFADQRRDGYEMVDLPQRPTARWTVPAADALALAGIADGEGRVVDQVGASASVVVVTLTMPPEASSAADQVVVAGIDLGSGALLWAQEVPDAGCQVVDDATTFCGGPRPMVGGMGDSGPITQIDTRTGERFETVQGIGHRGGDIISATPHGDTLDITATSRGELRWRTTTPMPDLLRAGVTRALLDPVLDDSGPDVVAVPLLGGCLLTTGASYTVAAERTILLDRGSGILLGELPGAAIERTGETWTVSVPDCDTAAVPAGRHRMHIDGAPAADSPDARVLAATYPLHGGGGATSVGAPRSTFKGELHGADRFRIYPHGPDAGDSWAISKEGKPWWVTAATDEVVFVTYRRRVEARDLDDGSLRWSTRGETSVEPLGLDSSRVVLGAIAAWDHFRSHRITAYDVATGDESWDYRATGGVAVAGGRLFDITDSSITLLR